MKKKYELSRRKFMHDAIAVSALGAIGFSTVISSCNRKPKYVAPVFRNSAPDGSLLKAGIIGCGGRGTGAAINFLKAGPNLEIKALGDVFQHRIDSCRNALKERAGISIPDQNCFTGFDAYKRVIDSDIDVVILCEPPYFRPRSFEYAVQARKHIFAEKPIGVDPVGIRAVMAAGRMAETAGLNIVVGTQRRNSPDYVKTYEMVRNGAIGDIISANCYWNGGPLWHVVKQPDWSDMEYMLRDWGNWTWLSGDHIVEQHVHNIDIINWFFGNHPSKAVGFGGRHRRPTGNQFDFFGIDFVYGAGKHVHSMCRQILDCANNISEMISGTKGYTNAQNKIWDYDDNLIWEYDYPRGEDGQALDRLAISPKDQEHINWVTAIRTGAYVNETQGICESNMVAVMGRESAYTGREVTWEEMMNSNMRLGPEDLKMGTINIPAVPRIPGSEGGRQRNG